MQDPLALRALQRAIELVTDETDSRRVQALSILAWLPPVAYDVSLSKDKSAVALALARRQGDRETLGEALTARLYALSGPDDIDAQTAVANEMLALERDAPSDSRSWITVEAFIARNAALLHRGELRAAASELAALRKLATACGYLEVRWFCDRIHAQHLIATGQLSGASEQLAQLEADAARLGLRDGPGLISLVRVGLLSASVGPRALQKLGDVPQLRARLDPQAQPGMFAWTGIVDAHTGRHEAARAVLDILAGDDFAHVPKNLGYLNALCQCAVLAIAVADGARAERLYALLQHYPRHETPNLVLISEGPVSYYLGLLAAFLDMPNVQEHFTLTVALCETRGLRPMLARAQLELARYLLQSKNEESKARGSAARSRAIEVADAVGMSWCADAARHLEG